MYLQVERQLAAQRLQRFGRPRALLQQLHLLKIEQVRFDDWLRLADASGRLKEAISDLSEIDANLTNLLAAKGDKARFMAFNLAMSVPHHNPIEYRIAMIPRGVGYEISDETLTQQRDNKPQPFKHIEAQHGDARYYEQEGTKKGLVRPNWEYNPTESALSQVPKMFQEPEDFRKRLASSTHYWLFAFSSG